MRTKCQKCANACARTPNLGPPHQSVHGLKTDCAMGLQLVTRGLSESLQRLCARVLGDGRACGEKIGVREFGDKGVRMAQTIDTFGIRMDMRDLDDALLQKTIDNQEAMIAQTPSMQPMIMPVLLQYIAERDRRLNEKIDTIVANVECCSDEENRVPTHGRASNGATYETPVRQSAIATLDKAPTSTAASGRSKRVRQTTDHFSTESKPLAVQTNKRPKSERSVLLGRMRKHPEFSATITQCEANKAQLIQAARELACPLLVADEVSKGTYRDDSLEVLMRMQMKQVAVADDGYRYDFVRLKEYIREHIGQRLVSPITKQPMSAQVRFTEPVTNRYGSRVFVGSGMDKVSKYETRTWRPTLNVPKPVA